MQEKYNAKITKRSDDFAKWYIDIIRQAQLCDYGADNGSVGGTIIFQPNSYALWEAIQNYLNHAFKKLGVQNVMFPMFITQEAFNLEKDHITGFQPELALVTIAGGEPLTQPIIIRPTSEVLFGKFFKKHVKSYNDLPLIYNQWCNVVRWEKTTKPFLRNSEFLWQEGHAIYNNADQAMKDTLKMINLYGQLVSELLCIKVIMGEKTAHERFAGAQNTYTIETMMQDGQALQAGTSHYFGTNFAKVFNITFTNRSNKLELAYQNSWGVSTRLIGALIMAHSDDEGLVLPYKIAPIQVQILNLKPKNDNLTAFISTIATTLEENKVRVKIDDSDKGFGYRRSACEVKGIPFRIEVGEQEQKNNAFTIINRHNKAKILYNMNETPLKFLSEEIINLGSNYDAQLLKKSEDQFNKNIKEILNYQEYKELISSHKGFFLVPFCGRITCEQEIKAETATQSRCVPFAMNKALTTCFKCKQKDAPWTYFARSY